MVDSIVLGPTDGYLDFLSLKGGHLAEFRNKSGEVRRASERLSETIEKKLVPLIKDWQYYGDDVRQPVLKAIQDYGSALVTAMAGDRDKDRESLVNLLSSISHLHTQQDEELPWEFLCIGDPAGPVSLDHFFGANAVVGRGTYERHDENVYRKRPDRLDVNKGPLAAWPANIRIPFGYAEDERLPSAHGSERGVFSQLGIATRSLVKLSRFSRNSITQLNDFLRKSELLTHFNCHATPATLYASGKLFVSELYEIDETKIDATSLCESSIVVLNCCDGHTMQHSVEPTLAKLIADEVQVVVATTAQINDQYATRWAYYFYQALQGGLDVAESILAARRQLLSMPDPDPSALLYAYLGEPHAKLRGVPVTL